jgi:hypothetical protein
MLIAMPGEATSPQRPRGTAPACVAALIGCVNDRDHRRAQAMAQLALVAAHPEPAEVVEGGPGCAPDTGAVSASREYFWPQLDPNTVVNFYLALAARDGWRYGTPADEPVQPPTSGPTPHGLDTYICLTKNIGGSRASWTLYFQDSSPHGSYGNVYDVDVWVPGPRDQPYC